MIHIRDAQIEKQYGKDDAKAIESALSNTVYLLSNSQETRKKIEAMCGKKLRWNKEKSSFDSVPTISEDRLRNLSLSEAVIIQQRKMPFITRYYPYDNYVYYNHFKKPAPLIPMALPTFCVFSLQSELLGLQKIGSRTNFVVSKRKQEIIEVVDSMTKQRIDSYSSDNKNEITNIIDDLIYE